MRFTATVGVEFETEDPSVAAKVLDGAMAEMSRYIARGHLWAGSPHTGVVPDSVVVWIASQGPHKGPTAEQITAEFAELTERLRRSAQQEIGAAGMTPA